MHKNAYLVHSTGRFNLSGKTALKNKEKLYAIDTGFRTINTNTINYEDTFFLENIVFNELISRGYAVYVGKTYKGEVDFVAIRNGKKCFNVTKTDSSKKEDYWHKHRFFQVNNSIVKYSM